MRDFIRKVATLFMIFAVVTAGGMAAFAGSATAETTTLAGDGSDTVSGFNASSSDHLEYDLSSDDTDFSTDGTETAYLNVSYNGEDYAMLEETIDDTSNSTYTLNLSHDELSDLPGDAGETVTVNATAWGEDADGTVSTSATEFAVDITFDNTYAVAEVTNDSAESEEIETGGFLGFGAESTDLYTYEDTVGIDGANTTVTVFDTSDGASTVDDRLEDAEDGDLIKEIAVGDGDNPIPAFYGEVNSDMVDVDTDTYAVYHGNGEWTFHLGDDYEGETEFSFSIETQSYSDSNYDSASMSEVFINDLGINAMSEFGVLESFNTFGFDAFSISSLGDLLPF